MSVYNERQEWMSLAIDSILKQSYKDFEFIIINDNPERKENEKLLEDYLRKDNRIVILNNEVNIGLTKSLNKGIKIARGEYIVRMDADDYSYPNRFEKQLRFMDNHPEIVASGCYAKLMNENGESTGKMFTSTDIKKLKALFPFRTPIYHPSAIIRRIIDEKIVQYDETFRYSQDYALWMNLIDKGISNIPEHLIKYRLSSNQISSVCQKTMKDLDVMVRNNALRKYYSNIGDFESNQLIALYYGNVEKKDNKSLATTLISVYKQNQNNSEIDIVVGFQYIFSLYCHYLAIYFPLCQALYYGYKMKKELNINTYWSILSIIKNKMISIIRKDGIQKDN